jgi:5-methyltetrahydropteroyltriglutamate--homocysteine methyltransferase
MFPTTIAGSLPKPPWLAQTERLWPEWRLSGEELAAATRDAVRIAVFEQLRSGVDCVTDGEQGRQHFVHGFLASIAGIDFEKKVRRGIRADRYEADCPTIVGDVRRTKPVHVDETCFARSLTGGMLKITIPGPMTIVDTLYDAHYGDRKRAAMAFARIINEEAHALVAAGVDVVQLDEPAFNVYFDEVEEWGIAALDAAFAGVKALRALHVCYGYGIEANVAWKRALGEEWDQYAHLFPMLAQSTVDQVSLELAGSRVPPRVLGLLGDKVAAVGVIDVASEAVETPEAVAQTIATTLEYLRPERVWCSTNCGMAPMKREIAYAKLQALGKGAALARTRAAQETTAATKRSSSA